MHFFVLKNKKHKFFKIIDCISFCHFDMPRLGALLCAVKVFFLVHLAFSYPLTETIFTLPENDFECLIAVDFIKSEEAMYRKERISMGLGITDVVSIWYTIDYLHKLNGSENTVGDSFLKIWYFGGGINSFHFLWGITAIVRIPTGPSMYVSEEWRTVARGINETSIGPIIQVKAFNLFFHGNLFYTFRQAEGENFYSGFHLHPFKNQTYASVLGFNPWYNGTFMDKNRLKNDYFSIAISALSNLWYPFICIGEMYYSHWVYRSTSENDAIKVEGLGINPLFVSGSIRYFFSQTSFAGICLVGALIEAPLQWSVGLNAAAFF